MINELGIKAWRKRPHSECAGIATPSRTRSRICGFDLRGAGHAGGLFRLVAREADLSVVAAP